MLPPRAPGHELRHRDACHDVGGLRLGLAFDLHRWRWRIAPVAARPLPACSLAGHAAVLCAPVTVEARAGYGRVFGMPASAADIARKARGTSEARSIALSIMSRGFCSLHAALSLACSRSRASSISLGVSFFPASC